MDPTTVFCPHRACPARGQTGQGNIGIHSQKEQRFICHACHKTFSARTGPVFYRLRTSAETVAIVVTLLAHGCPLQAIVAAFGFDERTVAAWWARSGRQGQAVHEHLVEQPRDLGQVQADELRVKKQRGIVRMALAMMVKTRLWLGGEVSEQRDLPLIRRLTERVRRCAARRPLLGSVSKVEMTTPMALICQVLFPSLSTFETPPARPICSNAFTRKSVGSSATLACCKARQAATCSGIWWRCAKPPNSELRAGARAKNSRKRSYTTLERHAA
jgi:transposase-like protein